MASSADQAYGALRERIVTLDLPPGALIREDELVGELAVGRTPVREALLRLARQRLVVTMARRGMFVSEVHVGEVGQVYELRCELEVLAAGWAAARGGPSAAPAIGAMVRELQRAPVDATALFDVDQRAHFLVYGLADNAFAHELLEASYWLSARMWHLAAGRVTRDAPFDLLIGVLEAIAIGDATGAADLARQHNDHAQQALRGAL